MEEQGGGLGDAPRATAALSVADELARFILNEMSPGQQLPSEAELAERYSVSRLTLREAVKVLAGRGLLDIGRGRRAVVTEPGSGALTDFIASIVLRDPRGMFDLLELRMSFEVQSATLAARRANRAGFAAMEAALAGMRECAESVEPASEDNEIAFHEHDVRFHGAVALASGNRMIMFMFESMAPTLRRGFHLSRLGQYERGGGLQDTLKAHTAIFEAIHSGNSKAAGAAMRAHLDDTERDIRFALNNRSAIPAGWLGPEGRDPR